MLLSDRQFPGGLAQKLPCPREEVFSLQLEEFRPSWNRLPIRLLIQAFELIPHLGLDGGYTLLGLEQLAAVLLASLRPSSVFFQVFQVFLQLRQALQFRLEASDLLLRPRQLLQELLCVGRPVFRPPPDGFGPLQLSREPVVFPISRVERGADLTGLLSFCFDVLVLRGGFVQFVLQALAFGFGRIEAGVQLVQVRFSQAAFEESRFGAEGVAVFAQESLGGLDAADAKEPGDLTDPAYALVVGEETKLLLAGVESGLEGRPVHPQQVLLDPARHVGRPADHGSVLGIQRLGARRSALESPPHGKRAAVGSQGHLDGGRVLGRAAAPGNKLVGEALSATAGAEKSPQDALEEGRLAGAVRADDPDRTLRRKEFHGLPELLVVLYEEALQDHAALSGSSLAARVRYARPFSRNSSANFASSSPRSLRSATNAANSSPRGPNTAVEEPLRSISSGRSSAGTSSEKFRQRRCRSLSSSRSTPLATPCLTSYALRRTIASSSSTPEVLSCTVSVSSAA